MKSVFIAIVSLMACIITHAQNEQSGVYLTADDYKNGKLSYANPCSEHSIKLNEFLGKPYITIKHKGGMIKVMKDSIYAFANCDGYAHRFYKRHDSDYVIEENKPLTIYARETGVTQNKGFKMGVEYFFSTTLSGDILELTADNLKSAYPKNHELHDAIDKLFPDGHGITDYDKYSKAFKVNHLLAQYLK